MTINTHNQDAIADSERVKKQSEEAILDVRGKAEVQIEEIQIKSDTLMVNINKAVPFSFLSSFNIAPKRCNEFQIFHFEASTQFS